MAETAPIPTHVAMLVLFSTLHGVLINAYFAHQLRKKGLFLIGSGH